MFARGQIAEDARKAGADLVGAEEIIAQIQNGELELGEFKRCLCTPDMYRELIKIAKILGPAGLMPNAKKGWLTRGEESDVEGLGWNSQT